MNPGQGLGAVSILGNVFFLHPCGIFGGILRDEEASQLDVWGESDRLVLFTEWAAGGVVVGGGGGDERGVKSLVGQCND